MSFGSPLLLLALLAVPVVLGAQAVARRRARRYAIRFTAVPALREAAAGGGPQWRRVVPTALLLAALAALGLALAKPRTTKAVPIERASIMLVLDHSRSMMATDVKPSRLDAGKRAANLFLDLLPAGIQVGVTTFSDVPDATQAPTSDHDVARRVVGQQTADGGTATGDALAVALSALEQARRQRGGTPPLPAAIVLLSDGATTVGRDPVAVAAEAKTQRIPIYTVALGTSDATVPNPGFGPPLLQVPPDPEGMARIASASGGKAFSAQSDDELSAIYKALGSQLGSRKTHREVTAAFATGGLALLLAAAAGSLRWGGRFP